jgi:hypothetical protein
MPQPPDDDATIRVKGPPGARPPNRADPSQFTVGSRRIPVWAMVVTPVLLLVIGIAAGFSLRPAPSPPIAAVVQPVAAPATPAPAQPRAAGPQLAPAAPAGFATRPGSPGAGPEAPDQAEFGIETATEQQILDHVPAAGAPDPTVFRFQPNPHILVLDFATLLDQGRMLNRVAALVEKAGLPHDRLLTSIDLDAAIRASGDTEETFYYGHDYGAASVIRFFALAARDNIRLDDEEDRLGRLIRQAGWFAPNAQAALISIPQVGANSRVSRAARATILHHELSHGEYFTNPAYVAFVHQFWTLTLTAEERDRIRNFLRSEGYDPGLEVVMENEAQAYLMFTDGAEFFTPEMIGMSNARLADLRNGFYRTMPVGWLRDDLGQTLSKTAADRP